MGQPLEEQLINQTTDSKCEGCHGSGWLTAMVDDPTQLEEAGQKEPCDFLQGCDECDYYDDDLAIKAAKKAGMEVDAHGVVTYTQKQIDFVKAKNPNIIKMSPPKIGEVSDPSLYLLTLIERALSEFKNEHLGEVSMDNDNDSGSLIVDIKTGDRVVSLLISTSDIQDVTDLEEPE